MGSDPFFHWYVGAWGAACAIALAMVAANPKAYTFVTCEYLRFLGVPWKLVTFAVSGVGMTVVAPHTGDPTWDYYDAAFMSALTFLTAPWTTGTLYLALRDGEYPNTWLPNIPASSVPYCSAGLLWNLDWRPGRGVTFSFQENDWPGAAPAAGFGRIFWIALPFMVIGAVSVLYFILP